MTPEHNAKAKHKDEAIAGGGGLFMIDHVNQLGKSMQSIANKRRITENPTDTTRTMGSILAKEHKGNPLNNVQTMQKY